MTHILFLACANVLEGQLAAPPEAVDRSRSHNRNRNRSRSRSRSRRRPAAVGVV